MKLKLETDQSHFGRGYKLTEFTCSKGHQRLRYTDQKIKLVLFCIRISNVKNMYICSFRYGPPTRTENRVIVENLSSRVSWQVSIFDASLNIQIKKIKNKKIKKKYR